MTHRIPDVSRARRHIIKRPRLTRLLDETSARIILLVAPAGYGKTTLAREWLEGSGRPYAWYGATQASADVAVLSLGIARSIESIAPGVADRLAATLRVPRDSPSVEGLADLIGEALVETPNAVLALDDCHLAGSRASEHLVHAIAQGSACRLIVASRVRPSWVSARSILYGEVAEFGSQLLSFSGEEAAAVLAHHGRKPSAGLLALADGWPAVIGLAALGERITVPEGQLRSPLYEYIAEELIEGTSPQTRVWLERISIAQRPCVDFLRSIAGKDASTVLDEAVRRGLCTVMPDGRIDLHPLLRRFLQRRVREDEALSSIAAAAVDHFLDQEDWDEAHHIAAEHGLHHRRLDIISNALPYLLMEGRTSTLRGWLQLARATEDDPVLDLVEAELAFLEADASRSRTLAFRAKQRLPHKHVLRSRANLRLGYADFLLEDLGAAAAEFLTAERTATNSAEIRAAKWGRFLTAVHTNLDEARVVLDELTKAATMDQPDDLVLVTQAWIELALQDGGLDEVVARAEPALHLIDRVDDPQRRTAFLLASSWASHLAAHYEQSLGIAERLLDEVSRYRLSFALPHAFVARAAALFGLRKFVPARRDLQESLRLATEDTHTRANAACGLARIELVAGRKSKALEHLDREPDAVAAPMRAEFFATRALVHACLQDPRAPDDAALAEKTSPAIEARVLAASARAVLALRQDGSPSTVAELVNAVRETGNYDGAILAWRAYPPLLEKIREVSDHEFARRMLPTESDRRVASQLGLERRATRSTEPLSPREEEVLGLIEKGMRNKEIAGALFISEVTVKVHVRNILRKLGARTRVEAVLLSRTED